MPPPPPQQHQQPLWQQAVAQPSEDLLRLRRVRLLEDFRRLDVRVARRREEGDRDAGDEKVGDGRVEEEVPKIVVNACIVTFERAKVVADVCLSSANCEKMRTPP